MMGTIRTFVAMPDWQQLEIFRQAMPVFGPQFEQVGASVDCGAWANTPTAWIWC